MGQAFIGSVPRPPNTRPIRQPPVRQGRFDPRRPDPFWRRQANGSRASITTSPSEPIAAGRSRDATTPAAMARQPARARGRCCRRLRASASPAGCWAARRSNRLRAGLPRRRVGDKTNNNGKDTPATSPWRGGRRGRADAPMPKAKPPDTQLDAVRWVGDGERPDARNSCTNAHQAHPRRRRWMVAPQREAPARRTICASRCATPASASRMIIGSLFAHFTQADASVARSEGPADRRIPKPTSPRHRAARSGPPASSAKARPSGSKSIRR